MVMFPIAAKACSIFKTPIEKYIYLNSHNPNGEISVLFERLLETYIWNHKDFFLLIGIYFWKQNSIAAIST